MKEIYKTIKYQDNEYKIAFNLNAMEEIQEEYGSLDEWGALTDGKSGETNIKALIFGFTAMINEGIDIDNDSRSSEEKLPFMTHKQVGRMLSDIGIDKMTEAMNQLVVESAGDDSKNE